jgi:hypothetical protein
MIPWELKARELANCTCEYGCNCQFGGLPDKGHCHAVFGFMVDEGHYGEVRLDGLAAAGVFKWPGPIHEGNGEGTAYIDVRADDAQREALLKIMSGEDTAPFATVFAVFASTLAKMHAPAFTAIDIDIDVEGRTGHVVVGDALNLQARPIANPVSGAPVRAQIVLPDGFEYEVAEVGSGTSRARGALPIEIDDKYAQFAHLHLNNDGVIRHRRA